MLKSYKTEIHPTLEQKTQINKTIGTCRWVYNFYLAHNKEQYETGNKFVSGMGFSKWLNKEFLPSNPEFNWAKEVSSKSVKQSIMNAERAYKRFFKGLARFPKFKKKNRSDVKMYFVKTDATVVIVCERHRIKIPTLGWVRLKEKGYLPTTKQSTIKSGTVSVRAGRYYVSVLVEEPETETPILNDFGIGIDLGIKDFAIVSDETVFPNINKTETIKKLEKQLKREQRCLSRKHEDYKKRKNKKGKGEATRQNIQKQTLKVQRLHQRLENIRTDYVNKCISEIVKTKPSYIVLEDLNVSGMMKNRHLSKSIANQKFREFRVKLGIKCKAMGIELRIVDRWYPSSKLCHECGTIKSDLKLSDRIYNCECGYKNDRDLNASLNLRDAKIYTVA